MAGPPTQEQKVRHGWYELHEVFFFFLISKCNCVKKAKTIHLKVYTMYTFKKTYPNQSMKSSKDHELEPTLIGKDNFSQLIY